MQKLQRLKVKSRNNTLRDAVRVMNDMDPEQKNKDTFKDFKNLKMLVLDWDRTVSLWSAAISFQLEKYYEKLRDQIEVTPL